MRRFHALRRGAATAVVIALSALTLAACSDTPEGQTVAEACQIVSTETATLSAQVSNVLTEMTAGDVKAADEAYASIVTGVQTVESLIDEPKVKAAFAEMFSPISSISDALAQLKADGALSDAAEVADASSKMIAASSDLKTAGTALNALCATRR
ncbi:hypothetical protein [Microbacterium gorillae]|uniref:hypothetical protein n=1 Tax=Microbacterium gorillae TaxID=1231063 RepID=UPI003D9665E4